MKKIFILLLMCSLFTFASVAVVKTTTGKVEVKRAGKSIKVTKGSKLEKGDIVMTKSKSSVAIMFDDGTTVSLGEKAIFVINKFKVKPSKKEYEVDLELKKGKAVFRSGKIGKLSPESVKFRIPSGVIGIRGTQFVVEAK